MSQVPTSRPQRVCPRCSTLAHTAEPRCPWCGGRYRRRPLLGMTVLLTLFALVVLAGVAAMLAVALVEADRRLDREVRSVRQELDRRLPRAPSATLP